MENMEETRRSTRSLRIGNSVLRQPEGNPTQTTTKTPLEVDLELEDPHTLDSNPDRQHIHPFEEPRIQQSVLGESTLAKSAKPWENFQMFPLTESEAATDCPSCRRCSNWAAQIRLHPPTPRLPTWLHQLNLSDWITFFPDGMDVKYVNREWSLGQRFHSGPLPRWEIAIV